MTSARKEMPGRLLRLLSLLQTRREWSGAQLAERLGVTDRTIRRDIERLRALDYPVTGTTGTAGGYRLAAGARLPPLQLEDDEAIATAVGLATAGRGTVRGIEESSMRALAKLERVLPARLRPQLAALSATTAVPHRAGPDVDPATLAVLASCSRDHELVSFDYRGRSGRDDTRRVEPHHLATFGGFWYLIAYDRDRGDWRTFRVDRIGRPAATRRRFPPRELPAADPVSYLTESFARATYRHTCWITVGLPAAAVRGGVFASIPGEITEQGPDGCVVRLSTESVQLAVQFVVAIAALGGEFTVRAPAEIRAALAELSRRLGDATTGRPPSRRRAGG